MSHCIDSIAYAGETPWHKIGARLTVSERFDVSRAFSAAGLDWDTCLADAFLAEGALVPGVRVVVRSDLGLPIGTVGDNYNPVQNRAFAESLAPIVDQGIASVEVAGSLRGGADVWALLRLHSQSLAGGDETRSYLLAHNNHVGRSALTLSYTAVRVVCANTLAAAREAREIVGRVRHTASAAHRLDDLVGAICDAELATARLYERLQTTRRTESMVDALLSSLGIAKDGKISDRLLDLAAAGRGNHEYRNTAWGLYNAATEYETHERRGTTERSALRILDGTSWATTALDCLDRVTA